VTRASASLARDWCADLGVPHPDDEEFESFRALICARAGIQLGPSKRSLLYARLVRRVRELGLGSFGEYYRRVVDPWDEDEMRRVLDRITTNETHFFREPHHFAYLERVLVPAWTEAADAGARPRHVRAWSAGCSTGEEPYSIAMILADALPASQGWSVEVKATDISSRVLGVARDATWPIERASEIPRHLLERFMLEGIGPKRGWLRAAPELRDLVRVERFNLNEARYPVDEPFDVVFCRNVLIYFERGRKRHVVERLAEQLAPAGRLFLGHAETVHSTVPALRCVGQTVYAVAGDADARDRAAGGRA
jgi:chemotaxis protein methyltransferase CheR